MKSLVAVLSLTSSLAMGAGVGVNVSKRGAEASLTHRIGQVELGLGLGVPVEGKMYVIPSVAYITHVTNGIDLATGVAAPTTTEAMPEADIRISQNVRFSITDRFQAVIGAYYETQTVSPVVGYHYTF